MSLAEDETPPREESPTLPLPHPSKRTTLPVEGARPLRPLRVAEFTPEDSSVLLQPYAPESTLAHRRLHPVVAPAGGTALGVEGYSIGEELGRGAQGVVYRATPDDGGPDVAIKLLRPEASEEQLERFEHAIDAMQALTDVPGVIQLLGRGRSESGSPYYVMELVHGPSLRAVLNKGRLAPRQLVSLLVQVARSLHGAHDRGVIHRDLKPENILIEETEGELRPRLADFGLARDLSQAAPTSTTGGLGGTPRYMSPEQVLAGPVTRRIDVYALGVILYEVISGTPPFLRGNPAAVVHAIVHEEPPRPRVRWTGLPEPLEDITLRALAKDPNERHPTAAAFAGQVQDALRGAEIGEVPKRKLRQGRGRWREPLRRRRKFLAGLALGYCLGLLVGAFVALG